MRTVKERVVQLNQEELIKLAEETWKQYLMMLRKIPDCLLEDHQPSDNVDVYLQLMNEIQEHAHNLPNLIGQNDREDLVAELSCAATFLEKLEAHPFLMHELNAFQLSMTYANKGLLSTEFKY
ncbi:hypothetical protein BTR23_10560 [Alkalihalophilus pseudofirmus]|nr:hypothetical protein BTR23_10560 [Alkalihalophilus pseudofirmus]